MATWRHRQGECHVKTEDWSSLTATSEGTPQIASKPPETRKNQGRILLQVLEGARHCWNFDFGLPASRTIDNKFLLFKATQLGILCYSSPRKRIHTPIPLLLTLLVRERSGSGKNIKTLKVKLKAVQRTDCWKDDKGYRIQDGKKKWK